MRFFLSFLVYFTRSIFFSSFAVFRSRRKTCGKVHVLSEYVLIHSTFFSPWQKNKKSKETKKYKKCCQYFFCVYPCLSQWKSTYCNKQKRPFLKRVFIPPFFLVLRREERKKKASHLFFFFFITCGACTGIQSLYLIFFFFWFFNKRKKCITCRIALTIVVYVKEG